MGLSGSSCKSNILASESDVGAKEGKSIGVLDFTTIYRDIINDNSFNGSRSSIADIMSGRVIIQQLHTMFSNSLSENKEVEEENDNNELEEKEIGEDNIINQENEEEKDENTNDKNNNQNDNLENKEKSEDFQENE